MCTSQQGTDGKYSEVTLTNFREKLNDYELERTVRVDSCDVAYNKIDDVIT